MSSQPGQEQGAALEPLTEAEVALVATLLSLVVRGDEQPGGAS